MRSSSTGSYKDKSPLERFCFLAAIIIIFTSTFGCSIAPPPSPRNGAGVALVKQFKERFGIVVSSTGDPYLRGLVDRLLSSTPAGRSWTGPYDIIIVNNASPLAASVGDNFIVLTSGLINRLDVEAEMAFILAHELAHYLLGHTSLVGRADTDFSATADVLPELEKDADRLGLELVIAAGYDPRLARVAIAKAYQGSNMLTPSASHPSFVSRISELEHGLARAKWVPPGTVDRRQFQVFKHSL